jgi:hypothetical protein
LVFFLCVVDDVDDAVDLFSGGVLLPESKLMIGYYVLLL